MLNVNIFSQRDPRWSAIKHGFTNKTIGVTGCTISCVSSVADYFGIKTNPKDLNALLIKKRAYSDGSSNGAGKGNLILWDAAGKALGLKFIKRVKSYNNADVANFIYKLRTPVLVEVDGKPIGAPGGKHWVIFIGDHIAIDPWTGKYTKTSQWKTLGYAVYQK